jgi:hypothetical protein
MQHHAMEGERSTEVPDEAANAVAEELLDLAIELTFPASDPVSIVSAFQAARARSDPA